MQLSLIILLGLFGAAYIYEKIFPVEEKTLGTKMSVLFTGFAILKDNNLGVFNAGSQHIVPAIHKTINGAIANAKSIGGTNIQVVQVEVHENNSLLLLSLDNVILRPTVIDIKQLIGLTHVTRKTLLNNWVNFIYRASEKLTGQFPVSLLDDCQAA